MAQKRLLQDGQYVCPKCSNIYEITNGDVDKGDGYCEACTDENEDNVALIPCKYN